MLWSLCKVFYWVSPQSDKHPETCQQKNDTMKTNKRNNEHEKMVYLYFPCIFPYIYIYIFFHYDSSLSLNTTALTRSLPVKVHGVDSAFAGGAPVEDFFQETWGFTYRILVVICEIGGWNVRKWKLFPFFPWLLSFCFMSFFFQEQLLKEKCKKEHFGWISRISHQKKLKDPKATPFGW